MRMGMAMLSLISILHVSILQVFYIFTSWEINSYEKYLLLHKFLNTVKTDHRLYVHSDKGTYYP